MSEAPERIEPNLVEIGNVGRVRTWAGRRVEYVRADLYAAQAQRIEELERECAELRIAASHNLDAAEGRKMTLDAIRTRLGIPQAGRGETIRAIDHLLAKIEP